MFSTSTVLIFVLGLPLGQTIYNLEYAEIEQSAPRICKMIVERYFRVSSLRHRRGFFKDKKRIRFFGACSSALWQKQGFSHQRRNSICTAERTLYIGYYGENLYTYNPDDFTSLTNKELCYATVLYKLKKVHEHCSLTSGYGYKFVSEGIEGLTSYGRNWRTFVPATWCSKE